MATERFKNLTIEKETGAVYTPFGMAHDLTISLLSNLEIRGSLSILEPAVGDGRLLREVLNSISTDINVRVVAYDLDNSVLLATEELLLSEFPHVHFEFHNKDIIEDYINGFMVGQEFDVVIANPPYLRTQIIGAEKSKQLSKIFNLRGRLDIYYIFILIAVELLSDRGVAGFITSNRFMKVKSGKSLRNLLLNRTELIEIIDFGDTKLFEAAVLPCTFVFRRGKTDPRSVSFYSIYQKGFETSSSKRTDFPYQLIRNENEIDFAGAKFDIQSGKLSVNESDGTWSVSSEESAVWLQQVDSNTSTRLGELGKIRVGIKTTADKVFILKDLVSLGDNIPELARPLVTHRNAGQIVGTAEPKWLVVYPHEVRDGKRAVIPLENFPKTANYLERHRDQLESRKYVKEAGRHWYEVWVPQDPSKWTKPKIVFRDIADTPQFWLEASGAIVNGDCYWLDAFDKVDDNELFLALGVLNSTFITEYYDRRVNNKLYAGKRRFMTQYVEKFPLPSLRTLEAQKVVNLVTQVVKRNDGLKPHEAEMLDELVYACFGLASKKS